VIWLDFSMCKFWDFSLFLKEKLKLKWWSTFRWHTIITES